MRCGSDPSCHTTSVGIRSPKSVLKQSTPWSSRPLSCARYQAFASGFVKSTSAMPACHMSHCQTSPAGVSTRYPFSRPSANRCERWATYGLIHAEIRSPLARNRASMPSGSGNVAGSHTKSHQWNCRIQKQSKWKTLRGISRSAMPSMNEVTVPSS
ncbi:hypothetical protein OJAG_01390 [Oerskovia enterophila]|uniref:Uncharacterized protein n=1 Tax=Oerskovia enterophila TaxID=43678 RepID=A0A161YKX8_9CELL|nr:hypothetical protein OJAG_01390 [Oerskovia enterophila]